LGVLTCERADRKSIHPLRAECGLNTNRDTLLSLVGRSSEGSHGDAINPLDRAACCGPDCDSLSELSIAACFFTNRNRIIPLGCATCVDTKCNCRNTLSC
jgi:hypothetical protein